MNNFQSTLTRDQSRDMWQTIADQGLVRQVDGQLLLQSIACRLYPAPELDQVCNALRDQRMDYATAEQSYMEHTEFAIPPLTPEAEAEEERQRLLSLGQIDMFDPPSHKPRKRRSYVQLDLDQFPNT